MQLPQCFLELMLGPPMHHSVVFGSAVRSGSPLPINTQSLWPLFLEPYCYHVARKEDSWDHAAATITRIISLAWSKLLCISKVPWERGQLGLADRLSNEHLRDEISN